MKETQISSKKKTFSPQGKVQGIIHEESELLQENLKDKIQKLHFLCSNYDPYNNEIPEETLQLLLEFDLDPQKHNPFTLTENLLVLLDHFTTLAQKST